MPEECKDEKRAAQQAGDRYYNAVTNWLTSAKRAEGEKQKAFVLARAYHRTLSFLRRCYERLRRRDPAAEAKLKETVELQELLEKDIKVLGAQTPQGDEA